MATKYYWAAKNLDVEVDREEMENREDVVLIPEVPEIINLEPIDKDPEFIPSANVYAGLIGNAPSELGTRACPAAEDAAEACRPFLVIKKEDDTEDGDDEGDDESDDESDDTPDTTPDTEPNIGG